MIWVYRLLYWPFFIILLPKYLVRLWRRGGKWHLRERLGEVAQVAKPPGVTRLWIQAVSVGELNSIKPLLKKLKENTRVEVALSVTTTTARKLAEEKFKGLYCQLFTFPLDNFAARVFRRVKPDRLLLVEGELWPELLHQAQKRRVPVTLINARLSDRSYRRMGVLAGPTRWILNKINMILTATRQDTERYLKLGANPEKVYETGNLKFDLAESKDLDAEEKEELRKSLGWNKEDPVVLGSSTWEGEELALVEAWESLREETPKLKLLLVPRHAERGNEIEEMLKSRKVNYSRRSRAERGAPVVLADTTGELARLLQLASLALIGKSLAPHTEGQSPIEAAAAGCAVLMGPGMSNFRDISVSLVKAEGGRWVAGPKELVLKLRELLANPSEREKTGEAARAWYLKNRGATERTLEYLELPGVAAVH